MKALLAVVDRTAVLFLGVAAGAAIGFAFAGGRTTTRGSDLPALPPPTTPASPGTAPEVAAALECAIPFQQQLLRTVAADRPVRIGVFGDSFGDGVWSGLQRQLTRKAGYEVVKFSQQATGFTRYKSLNLEAHAAEQLGDAPIDVAVISYGANDTQGVITSQGKYAALLDDKWQAEIGGRVERFVALMRRHGAMVYWVGLPRMRKDSFDADIGGMNAFYARLMARLGVPFIDTRPYASGPAGEYEAYLVDPADGKRTLIRADDGIHMSMTGYVWITRDLAARIRAYVDAARVMAGVKPGAMPVALPPPPALPAVPPKPAAVAEAMPPEPKAPPKPEPRVEPKLEPPKRTEPAPPPKLELPADLTPENASAPARDAQQ